MNVEKLREGLKNSMSDEKIVLLITKSDEYQRTNLETLRYFVDDKGLFGIYVTINKPYTTIKKTINNDGIDTTNIFFVDAISKEVGGTTKNADDVVYMDSPQDLTNLSIALSEIVEAMPKQDKFLLIDSMSSLTIYNHSKKVSKFARHLVGKMRKWDLNGVIISIEEELEEDILSHFTQFCDKVIRVSEED